MTNNKLTEAEEKMLWWVRATAAAEKHFQNAGMKTKNTGGTPSPHNSWRIETSITDPSDAPRGVEVLMKQVRKRGGITVAFNCYMMPIESGLKIGAYFV